MDVLSGQWVPYHILFASTYDNRQAEIRTSLESLQSFSYEDILKNLKHSHSFMEEDESCDRNDIVRGRRFGTVYQVTSAERLFRVKEPRMGFGDWSHGCRHLHVFGSYHS
ncbi:hypothetical protein TNCV_1179111 [Trichonephila clavipes]|nr:hypothetical protein TNCV_1179111 [Trichonephila clavipes]